MSQLKIFTTAIFAVCILNQRLSRVQWFALFSLFGGIVTVQLEQNNTAAKKSQSVDDEAQPLIG
jgi:drug/metabolite transporter (DMT)-like permease